MAKARKLPSGNWRVQVFAGHDSAGRRKYKSFTETTERKANLAAMQWQEHYKEIASDSANMTLDEAMSAYIESKSNILSPATLRGYEVIRNHRLNGIKNHKLSTLDNRIIQTAVNEEAKTVSGKTIKNSVGLLTTVLKEYRPDFRLNISIPAAKPFEGQALTAEQISILFDAIAGDRAEIPILLALWLGLRRSEIFGLKWSSVDFENSTIKIETALVPDRNHKMVEKGTKTFASTRTLRVPDYIMDKLKGIAREGDRVFTMSPHVPLKSLKIICEKHGLPSLRLHDLRHTMASIGPLLNIADKYMMERGGWSSPQTMRNIYQHALSDGIKATDDLIDSFFYGLMQHEMQHKKPE